MNYAAHYDRLIQRAIGRKLVNCYVEKHHIVPRCLGGKNTIENLVYLTPEEHFVAHQLLVKIHPYNPKLAYAALMMTANNAFVKRNNKAYGWLRALVSNHKKGQRGIKHSEESKVKRSKKLKGKPLSAETREKLKQAWARRRLEKPMTQETKEKLRLASTGKRHTIETKAKIAAAKMGNNYRSLSYAI